MLGIASRSPSRSLQCHERVRKDLWVYAADEALSNEELIKKATRVFAQHQTIQLASEHTVKTEMFETNAMRKIEMYIPNHGPHSGCCGVGILLRTSRNEITLMSVRLAMTGYAGYGSARGVTKGRSGGWRRACDVKSFMIIVHK